VRRLASIGTNRNELLEVPPCPPRVDGANGVPTISFAKLFHGRKSEEPGSSSSVTTFLYHEDDATDNMVPVFVTVEKEKRKVWPLLPRQESESRRMGFLARLLVGRARKPIPRSPSYLRNFNAEVGGAKWDDGAILSFVSFTRTQTTDNPTWETAHPCIPAPANSSCQSRAAPGARADRGSGACDRGSDGERTARWCRW
jgi:hypothetical protein